MIDKRCFTCKRDSNYTTKSLYELIVQYAHESDRINQDERKATQKAIVLEVYARVKDTFDLLDTVPDFSEQIYNQLWGEKSRTDRCCFACDSYDLDFGCTCPATDMWYACPLEPAPEPQIFIGTVEDGENNKTE